MLRDTKHPVFGNGAALAHTQASDRIRCLLHSANARYHVNDNVSAFIEEGELQELMAELQDRM